MSGGLHTSPETMDTDVNGGVYAGNGSAGDLFQIGVYGRRMTIRSPTLIGRESQEIAKNEDFGALPMSGSSGIWVNHPATDIKILQPNFHNLTYPIYVAPTVTGSVFVDYCDQGVPSGYGSPGSTYHRLDGSTSSSLYIKETASSRSDGWRAV